MPLDNSNNMQEADLIHGARAIAEELNVSVRRVNYLRETGSLPIGKLGGVLVTSRSQLREFVNRLINAEVVTHD